MADEKRKLEEAACRYFLNIYNEEQGTSFKIIEHGDKPDFVVEDGSGRLGIEITHLYYGDEEAMMLFGRSDKMSSGVQIFPTLIENINVLLADKAKQVRGYDFSNPIILMIRAASPIFNTSDFEALEQDIIVPESAFAEIWLLARSEETGAWGRLKRLK